MTANDWLFWHTTGGPWLAALIIMGVVNCVVQARR